MWRCPFIRFFGVFSTPERQLIFDINDFSETLPGPWEWDVGNGWRPASTSWAGSAGFPRTTGAAIVTAGVGEYRERMRRADAGMSTLHAWYDQLEAGVLLGPGPPGGPGQASLDKQSARRAEKHVTQAYANDSARVFAKRAGQVGGELRIAADPPLIVPIEDLIVPGSEWEDPAPLIKKLLGSYRRTLSHQGHPLEEFRYVHAARKVVGVGSVRHPLLHLAAHRPGSQRPAVPAGERGASLGVGAVRGPQHFPPSRAAGGDGPAPDAGRH